MIRCDDCGVHAANVHLTQIVNGQVSVAHLCEECARKKGISISIATENAVAQSVAQTPAPAAQPDISCDNCGLKFSDFRTKGWLGCPECYDKFEKEVDDLLVQMHGSCVHRGKGYSHSATPVRDDVDVRRLRSQLDKAIRDEEFELAAAIRDVLRSMELDSTKA